LILIPCCLVTATDAGAFPGTPAFGRKTSGQPRRHVGSRLFLRSFCYSDRDQHADRPYSSKNLRERYRRGAEA
jgi:hypothetical protein